MHSTPHEAISPGTVLRKVLRERSTNSDWNCLDAAALRTNFINADTCEEAQMLTV